MRWNFLRTANQIWFWEFKLGLGYMSKKEFSYQSLFLLKILWEHQIYKKYVKIQNCRPKWSKQPQSRRFWLFSQSMFYLNFFCQIMSVFCIFITIITKMLLFNVIYNLGNKDDNGVVFDFPFKKKKMQKPIHIFL